ncbi:serine protease FAM111B-like [Phyllostomus hastatus]|uniref:serine protease FAM111B-like n=1 Tax=Phyllostomus hastatus TaxID=9423 RepID=UPI001E67F949|nr:serine protease FAM111B-like [Phyllostomus hastatus]
MPDSGVLPGDLRVPLLATRPPDPGSRGRGAPPPAARVRVHRPLGHADSLACGEVGEVKRGSPGPSRPHTAPAVGPLGPLEAGGARGTDGHPRDPDSCLCPVRAVFRSGRQVEPGMPDPPSPTPQRRRAATAPQQAPGRGGDRPLVPQLLKLDPGFPLRAAPHNQNAGKSRVTRLLPRACSWRPQRTGKAGKGQRVRVAPGLPRKAAAGRAPRSGPTGREALRRRPERGIFHFPLGCAFARQPAQRRRRSSCRSQGGSHRPGRGQILGSHRRVSPVPLTPIWPEIQVICSGRIDPVPVSSSGPVVDVSEILLGLIMNPVQCEDNKSLGATENDQCSTPEVTKDIVTKQTRSSTTVGPSPCDTGKGSGTVQCEVGGHEASLKIRNPDVSRSDKCSFRFTFKEGSGKRDHSVFTACGELNESIDSALRANENVLKKIEKCSNKNIFVYGKEAIEGYINLGMPLKCLPEGSKLEISVGQRKGNQKEGDQILRLYENPSIECVLFHVVAIGKSIKKIVSNRALHEMGSILCVYALKGETVREALCKDGRFRSDLDEFEWKLIENHRNIHGKQSTVEEVAGKTLELDVSKKPPVRKRTPLKTRQNNGNATHEISPYDVMLRQNQDHQPEYDGESEGVEDEDQENVLPPGSLENDLEGKKRRTISRMKRYYSESNRKCGKQTSRAWERPRLHMERAINQGIQEEAAQHWLQHCTVLNSVVMWRNPRFSEDARWMRKYFEEEQKRTELPPSQQFKIYKECFVNVTKNSVSVATSKCQTRLSESVGFLIWDNNGIKGNATCFVFSDGYILTCRHIVHRMVGEYTHPSLWPHIISKCAKVTFTYKEFCPPAEEWFSLEPCVDVSAGDLDYAILKLRANGNGFPPGLVGQISSLPSSGLIYIIGHPEGRTKEIDGCAVITLPEREGRYLQHYQHGVAGPHAATHDVCSMFTPRSFPPEAYVNRTDILRYDTCFRSGSSGSPVFNADGKVVAVHSFGQFYKSEGKDHAFIEFGYSMDSILCDLKQRKEPLYALLTGEKKHENLNQEKTNKQESSLGDDQIESMEH